VPVAEVQPMRVFVDRAMAPTRFAFVLIGIFAAVAAVLAAVLTVGLTYRKAKDANVAFKLPVFETIAAIVAFGAWAVALPETPLASWCGYDDSAGAFIVLGTTVAVTTAGYILGKTARFEKV
jgi:hypothetical protein